MIGLDTNVLARAILVDDPIWTPKAQRFLVHEITAESPGYVNLVTLAELAWTLRKSGGFDRSRLADVVVGLLGAENIVVERPDLVSRALSVYRSGGAGFADYLIAELNSAAGANCTVTIDAKAGSRPMFTPLS
ncbi:MAG: type II toxin-antitoxin system VapC family toxin [Ancalomicrobiaceae bacterium]|nr:type II toxin-antitoxin system VapC family toxin [Ancalomicrobiaceae bacterium]